MKKLSDDEIKGIEFMLNEADNNPEFDANDYPHTIRYDIPRLIAEVKALRKVYKAGKKLRKAEDDYEIRHCRNESKFYLVEKAALKFDLAIEAYESNDKTT